MNEGQRFVSALVRIGYLPAFELNGSSFEWMFENEKLVPFFRTFCDFVEDGNFLSGEENEEFLKMLSVSENILIGNELEKALNCLDVYSEESSDCIKDEIQDLVQELNSIEYYAEHLLHQRNFLSLHETQLCLYATALDEMTYMLDKDIRYLETEEDFLDKQVENCLNSVATTIQDFASLFHQESCFRDGITLHTSPLNANLKCYQTAEYHVLEELKLYIQLHFGKSLPISSEKHSVLNDGYNQFHNKNDSLNEAMHCSSDAICDGEIDRLRTALKACEEARLKSFVSVFYCEGEVEYYKSKMKHGMLSFLPFSSLELHRQIDKAGTSLTSSYCEMIDLKECISSKVYQWCNQYQNSLILLENYEEKLKRQEYFLLKQENILYHLIYQHSRQILTLITMNIKKLQLQNIYNILQHFDSDISEDWNEFCRRDSGMKCLQKNFHMQEQADNTIDSLSKVLGNKSCATALYLTKCALSNVCKQVQIENASLKSELLHVASDQTYLFLISEEDLKTLGMENCQQTVFTSSNINHGDLSYDTIKNLDSNVQLLEQSFLSSRKEIDKTRKVIIENEMQLQLRSLFLYFFLEPKKLIEKLHYLQIDVEGERLLNL